MIPDPIEDHVARAQSRFTSLFQNKRVIAALLRSIIRQVQDLENATWDAIHARRLDDPRCIGVQLDAIGAIVGVKREARSDAAYRAAIRLQILLNRSKGSVSDLLAILAVAAGVNPWEYYENYPAGYSVLFGGSQADYNALLNALRRADPAGVSGKILYTEVDPSRLWTPGHFNGSGVVGGLGLGNSSDPDPTYAVSGHIISINES